MVYLSKMSNNNLKAMITLCYGSQRAMAEELGVTPQTVTNWMKHDPTPMLRHSAAISGTGKVTLKELVSLVSNHREICAKDA
jgi:DNA-binding XRE family transcriptional regulator